MTSARAGEPSATSTVRWRPAVVLVVIQWLAWFGVPLLAPQHSILGLFGGALAAVAVLVWWAFFSRAPRAERWGVMVLVIVSLAATPAILHESVATVGMGVLFYLYALPVLSTALVVAALASRGLGAAPRRAMMVGSVLAACGVFGLLRTHGVSGGGEADFAWRWEATPEERLLARIGDRPAPLAPLPAGATEADWPGFRGLERDGVVRGVRIETDWAASPPIELWRRPIGPGWSSFAVRGRRVYTQEQRGDEEVVACYDAATGGPAWAHRDPVRFWEAMAGAGPRATPTLAGDRLYAFGATGILNALDAEDGSLLWSRDAGAEAGVEVPGWGFASSPLVTGDQVIVAAAGRLIAYDRSSGERLWLGPAGGESYSSPQLLTIDGVAQLLLLDGVRLSSVSPDDGTLLWAHPWSGFHSLQPALTGEGDVLFAASGAAGGLGLRRLAVSGRPDGWTVEERWTSRALKPYFNDFVVHQGHAYGFDGRILASIDLEDGERNWKGGRYGSGQLVLLADQGLLLVISERGELALVAATPERLTELARLPAIEGKTWNHPAVVGDLLLVRNGREMAAFRLPLTSSAPPSRAAVTTATAAVP